MFITWDHSLYFRGPDIQFDISNSEPILTSSALFRNKSRRPENLPPTYNLPVGTAGPGLIGFETCHHPRFLPSLAGTPSSHNAVFSRVSTVQGFVNFYSYFKITSDPPVHFWFIKVYWINETNFNLQLNRKVHPLKFHPFSPEPQCLIKGEIC